MKERLSLASTKLEWREHFPDLSGTGFVEVLKADARRWAIMTCPRTVNGYEISINPGAKPGQDFFIRDTKPFIFSFRDLGPIVQGTWFFRSALGENSVTVYEVFVIEG